MTGNARPNRSESTDVASPPDGIVSALLNSIPDGCFVVADDWTVTYLNRACEDYVGRDGDEIIGRPVWDAHPALRGTECERQLRAAMTERAPRQTELQSAVQPGHRIELRMFPVQDGLAVILRDVTEVRAREKALQDSERRFRLLTHLVPAFVWFARPDGGLEFLNDRWVEFTGQSLGRALPDGWIDVVHPDDRARALEAWRNARQLGIRYEVEVRYRRRDNVYRWYVARAEPLRDDTGRITCWFGTSTDIHENQLAQQALRESEARFRNLADNAPVMIRITEPDGLCTYLNRRWYEFTGQTPGTGLDTGWLNAVHADDRAEADWTFREANASRAAFRLEYRLRRADAEWRWVLDTATPRLAEGGAFLGFIGSVIDITDRKQGEQRLQLLAREVDHRAKNILSLVQVIVRQTRASSVAQFVKIATARLYALGRAHTLLSQARWTGAELHRLIEEELAPFRQGPDARVRISGPAVRLGPEAAQSFAMALHELTTNATKHGALSTPQGVVTVEWTGGGREPLVLRWCESGGPAVRQPERAGTGLDVITRTATGQLNGSVRFDWRPDGFVCEIVVPTDKLVSRL
jgi:PAS domain S-box-containing protein